LKIIDPEKLLLERLKYIYHFMNISYTPKEI
jgi:hypothetical protein